ncbi:ABC transporter permease [Lentzea sp. NPDC051208]|uniref:ABC transporter permease n=1 Tax=Lentzea sp. NPDC051208 TaxID=3154642 RepID=UPI003446ED3F
MTSAYPTSMDKLTVQVRALAEEIGETPSANQIMTRFRVGRPKAREALAALAVDTANAAETDAVGSASEAAHDEPSARRLHAVPELTAAPVEPADRTLLEAAEEAPAAPSVTEALTAEPTPGALVSPAETAGEAETTVQASPIAGAPVPTSPPSGRTGWMGTRSQVRRWPIVLIALGAFVSIWGGWVELGKLTGFGEITPLPGIADDWTINSAITLPLGMEAYAALALQVWLSGRTRSDKARSFAKWSALGALVLGAGGQVAYHLMKAAGMTVAPWQITTVVSCLPVIVLGFGAALVHLMADDNTHDSEQEEVR